MSTTYFYVVNSAFEDLMTSILEHGSCPMKFAVLCNKETVPATSIYLWTPTAPTHIEAQFLKTQSSLELLVEFGSN